MRSINVILLLGTLCSCSPKPEADMVIHGKIWTGNPNQPIAEAMAVKGDSILAVGKKNEIDKWQGDNTAQIDAKEGQLIVPGFIDTHTHFVEGGFRLSSVLLRDAKTQQEFIKRIKDYVATVPSGTWIVGGDWDHQNWGGNMPERDWIDSISPLNPVWINRLDGHMKLGNSFALKAAGIDDNVKNVAGGTIDRNKKGKVTGIFRDNAQGLIDSVVPEPSAEQQDKALDAHVVRPELSVEAQVRDEQDEW